MRFANPEALWALLALPALALLLAWSLRRRRAIAARFVSAGLLSRLAPGHSPARVAAKATAVVLACAGVIFAAARPQWGYEDRKISSRGIDLMVAVDTSLSMQSQDYKPNRLARAKDLLQNILWTAKGDRVGVIAFARDAYVMCPLTLDYGMAASALRSIGPDTVPAQGTAVGDAIRAAVRAFDTASAGERVLVLLTDGEDQGSEPVKAAEDAKRSHVRIHTIGIGTSEGMPIPLGEGGYKQDREGRVVNSKLDFSTLTKIAQVTGGKAIRANASGAAELDAVVADIERLQKTRQQDAVFRVYTERFQWFLLPAILLLVWEMLETGASRRAARRRLATGGAAALLLGLTAPAGAWPGEANLLAREAQKQYQSGDFKKAEDLYGQAAEKAPNAPELKLNLGNAQYQAGKQEKALESFKGVYDEKKPGLNADAKFNAGVVRQNLAAKAVEELQKASDPASAAATAPGGASKTAGAEKPPLDRAIERLEQALGDYRSAILSNSADPDMKFNYELASRQLEELLRRKQQQQQQQQQQNQDKDQKDQDKNQQQQQQQQNQDKKDQDKNQQQQQNQQDQKNQDKDQQQKQDQEQKDQKEQKGQQDEPKPEQGENKDQKSDPKEQDKPKPEKPDEGKEQEPKDQKEGEPKDPRDARGASDPNKQQPVKPGEMSPEDVDRLLNSLPDSDLRALQRFYNNNPNTRGSMEKDW